MCAKINFRLKLDD